MRTWVKLYTEILRDPKMAALPDHRFRVCVNLFALAGQLDEDGRLGTTEDVAFHLRLEAADVADEMQSLAEVGVTMCKKGVWWLKNWQTRNGKAASDKPESRRERVQKWRENKAKVDDVKREGNADVTPLHPPRNGSRKEKNREEEIREEQPSVGGSAPTSAPEPDPVKELAVIFEQASGIKRPEPTTKSGRETVGVTWWKPLREMVQMANGSAAGRLQEAVIKMRRDDLTIKAPASVLAVFTSLDGKAKTSASPPRPAIDPQNLTPEQQELKARLNAKRREVANANP